MAEQTTREREHDAAKRSLERAIQALNDAALTVGVWADAVSAETEKRLGVDVEDPRRYDDPEYAGALDVVARVSQAQQDLRQAARLIDWKPGA